MTFICPRKVIRQGLLCLRTFRAGCIVYSYALGAHFLTQHRYTQLKPLANEQNIPFSTTNKRYITASSRRGSGLRAPGAHGPLGLGPVGPFVNPSLFSMCLFPRLYFLP